MNQYGPGFRRGWAKGNLAQRAETHDLQDGYDGYRILSAVIHGSSGGLRGLTRTIAGAGVYRIGFDIELVGPAYTEGLGSFRNLALKLQELTGQWQAQLLVDAAGNLLVAWPEVSRALRGLDAKSWPAGAPAQPVAVAVVHGGSMVRWYWYEPATLLMVIADPPNTLPDLTDFLDAASRHDPSTVGGRPALRPFPGVQVEPRQGAHWFPATALFSPSNEP